MSGITSLFRDDAYSGSERKHYAWLRKYYFPETDFIIYPNVALGVIIDPDSPQVKKELSSESTFIEPLDMQWCTQNFFANSSVDLCVIGKSDYMPLVAFEIDGPSHLQEDQKRKDSLKDLIFEKAGVPLLRLAVSEDQFESEKRRSLARALSSLSRKHEHTADASIDAVAKRSILFGTDIREYYDLLRRIFDGDDCLVFPNVALQSIFHYEHVRRLTEYNERNLCQTGLVDFCVVGAQDLRPRVAFSIGRNELRRKVFNSFGLPLLHLRSYEDIGK